MHIQIENHYVSVQQEDFDLSLESHRLHALCDNANYNEFTKALSNYDDIKPIDALSSVSCKSSEIGAIVSFVGTVREFSNQQQLKSMHLEHYPLMTEKQLIDISKQAKNRWPLLSTSIIHRVGTLSPSDNIVYVGVTSAHRKAAFEACDFIMDILKTTATFWKRENFDSHHSWVEAKESDQNCAKQWDLEE